MRRKKTTFQNVFKKFDLYGHPVALVFEGDSKFKSVIGGAAGLATGILLLAYFFIAVVSVINKTPTIKNSMSVINTSIDPHEYNVD